jgi:glycosyltransferase involved in cell wall biosynthesis
MPSAPSILRLSWKTDVTICIPAYQAANFIDRTLRCAQGQTYGGVRILVAVDRSTDETAAICRQFEKTDHRIEIIEHEQRLGWCGNVNSLIERVDTPFFTLYFHDDLILPQYCEELRQRLLQYPEAASSNCDFLLFGLLDRLVAGHTFDGSTAKRILTLWTTYPRGQFLRSMIRREKVGPNYRLPPEEQYGFTTGHVLQTRTIAAGLAVRVPETLYLRWARKAGMTHGWKDLPYESVLRSRRGDLGRLFAVVDENVSETDDRQVIKLAMTLDSYKRLAARCRIDGRAPPQVADLHPEAPKLVLPNDVERFGPEIAQYFWKKLHNNKKSIERGEKETTTTPKTNGESRRPE